jgi:hypothetical protein
MRHESFAFSEPGQRKEKRPSSKTYNMPGINHTGKKKPIQMLIQ